MSSGKEMISRKEKQQLKKAAHVLLLGVDNNQGSSSKNSIEVKDTWVQSRATLGSGGAGHVTNEGNVPSCEPRSQDRTKDTCGSEW